MATPVPSRPSLLDRALKVTPGGAQTRSKRPDRFPWEPKFLSYGEGAYVWDTEGKKYIDWICGLGAISLGYRYSRVNRAVALEFSEFGNCFSLPTEIEVDVSEQACQLLQADQIRWVKTGSEATEGAMRIARLATGRDTILSIGYHGWHSVHDASITPETPAGVPWELQDVYLGWPWGEPIDWEIRDLAAVLAEPCRDKEPPAGYLHELRNWCSKRGALLIFDECVTGFRWAIRGASEYFGIEPDLRVYGKGMANGWPLACIVGGRDLMKHAEYVSGTFGGETLSLAAAGATMREYQDKDVIPQMWFVGSHLMEKFNRLGGPVRMEGYPVHPRITGERRDEFIRLVSDEGVLFHPSGFNVSFSHTGEILMETLEACRRVMEKMK